MQQLLNPQEKCHLHYNYCIQALENTFIKNYAEVSTAGAALDTITMAGRTKRPFNS